MRIVVTGGHGFVGSHLTSALVRDGHEVTVVDTGPKPPDCDLSYRVMAQDIRDAQVAREIEKADQVFHLAAVVGVDQYLSRPLDVMEHNVLGTYEILRAARDGDTKVVLASTSEVFGRNPQVPWDENSDRVLGSTQIDRWSYSTSKAAAEHLAFGFHRQHELPVTVVRYFNVYGPRQRPAFMISRSIRRALLGHAPYLYDTGQQVRCPTYITDAIEGTLAAAGSDAAQGESFNLGSDTPHTVEEVVRQVCDSVGGGISPQQFSTEEHLGTRYEDIPDRVPNPLKASQLLGWKASTSLHDGVDQTVAWARENPWWLNGLDRL